MANPPKQTYSRVPFGLDAEGLVKELMENVAAGTCNNLMKPPRYLIVI